MTRWFRVYDDLVDDPKVQQLPAELFRAIVNLWCLASRNEDGALPNINSIAFSLRITPAKAKVLLGKLVDFGLLDEDFEGLKPHNWAARQFKSDVSTERVKRFRKRAATVTATPPETETETETEKKKEATAIAVASPAGFQGKVVRLNAKDFASWQAAYQRLDLRAELTARDEWLAEQPPPIRSRWFQSTSKYLANRNMEARAKGEIVAQPYKSRTNEAFDQLDEVIRHGIGEFGICEERGTAALLEFPQPSSRSAGIRGAIDEGPRGPAEIRVASFGGSTDGLPCDCEVPDDC